MKYSRCRSLVATVLALSLAKSCFGTALAEPNPLRLSGMFSSHMVLQRDATVPVWGWAGAGDAITVTLSDHTVKGVAAPDGAWRVNLPAMPAGGPFELLVAGKSTLRLEDVYLGEVWVCAGQSNMEMHLRPGPDAVYNAEQEVATANFPQIRLLTMPRAPHFEPQADVDTGGWQVCTPDSVITFSAAGYFFGRDLYQHLKVPIGLINCSKGASPAEAWTSTEALAALPDFKRAIKELPAQIAESKSLLPEYSRALAAWNASLETEDGGQHDGMPRWAAPDLDDSDWKTMAVPDHWENAGYADFDGVMWFRKSVDLPPEWAGNSATLGLCTINDMDRAYVNGVEVGRFEDTAGWTAPRHYAVPPGCLRKGRNVIAVRVFDAGNKGGICGAADDLWIRPAAGTEGSSISLAGPWRLKPGLDLKSIPPKPAAPPLMESNHRTPGVLFNGMVAPMIPYGIRGVAWYQGESNSSRPDQYATLFPAMIQDWRAHWGQPALPFLFVQLSSLGEFPPEPVDDDMARTREAQTRALALPQTAMAVSFDIGDPVLGHPRNKQDVGHRLAAAARHVAYGEDIVAWGPLYRSMKVEESTIRIQFDSVGTGLTAKDGGNLRGFAVAGEDRTFVWADATLDQDTVVVSSARVPKPVAVRYAWSIYPEGNLFNREGFPASPFRTDDWPQVRTETP